MITDSVSWADSTDVADTMPSNPVPPWKLMWSPTVMWSIPASAAESRRSRRSAGFGTRSASVTDKPTLIDTLISSHANGLTINFSPGPWQGRTRLSLPERARRGRVVAAKTFGIVDVPVEGGGVGDGGPVDRGL